MLWQMLASAKGDKEFPRAGKEAGEWLGGALPRPAR